MSQRRDFYRIVFPPSQRPRLLAGDTEFDVLDISETGARLATVAPLSSTWVSPLRVRITFHDGTESTATAIMHREDEGCAIIRFLEGIPLPVIIHEQRRLLAMFPKEALQQPPPQHDVASQSAGDSAERRPQPAEN